MRILALDQSSVTTGYSIFDDGQLIDYGKFKLTDEHVGQRLVKYKKKIAELIEKYDVDEVAFEDIQMQNQINNVYTFKVLAEIYGVTEEYLSEQGHSYQVISSNTWKSELGIKGKKRDEQKRNCQEYVLQHYGQKVTQDEADAIAIGIVASKKYTVFDWS